VSNKKKAINSLTRINRRTSLQASQITSGLDAHTVTPAPILVNAKAAQPRYACSPLLPKLVDARDVLQMHRILRGLHKAKVIHVGTGYGCGVTRIFYDKGDA